MTRVLLVEVVEWSCLLVTEISGSLVSCAAGGAGAAPTMRLAQPSSVRVGGNGSGAPWVLQESQFDEGVVGGKSRNLALLKSKLPDW
jgi:hypothetical protein